MERCRMRNAKNLGNHELIGLNVQVYKASSDQRVLDGRVVDETMNTFVLETGSGDNRIAKHGHFFDFQLDGAIVRINGDRIRFRPEDRTKKVKRVM